jgi:alkylation response protein AidB-like acyl-CoA dehydrogenase
LAHTEIDTVGGISTSATYYEDVRVPLSNLVGPINQGWRLITNQLNHERVALAARGGIANELFSRWAIACCSTCHGCAASSPRSTRC